MQRPRVFVGSSTEGLATAEALAVHIERVADVRLWTGVFGLGDTTIEALFAQLSGVTHAVLVATADDTTQKQGESVATPRDNVVFELGLFMGRLGRRRAYLVADSASRLPSDLAGVTVEFFDGKAKDSSTKLAAIAERLSAIVTENTIDDDAGVLQSLIRIIGTQRITPGHTFADILKNRYATIEHEVKALRRSKSWASLLEVKVLLREYFEYSGEYPKAIDFGDHYVEALTALGRSFEAAWSRTRDIGYMSILAGRHEEGRKAIRRVLSTRDQWSAGTSGDEVAELLAYAHRYLAISYQRDRALHELEKARSHLDLAERQASTIPPDSKTHQELRARLERNRGHLDLEEGNVDSAMKRYETSLAEFRRLEDYEHIASTRLALARALMMRGGAIHEEVIEHLTAAERSYQYLGALEGEAKVCLAFAKHWLTEASRLAPGDALAALRNAESYADRAGFLFKRLASTQFNRDLDDLHADIQAARLNHH